MKTKNSHVVGALSIAFLCASVWSCQPSFADDEQWGYVNVVGEFIIKPKYLSAGNFSSGLAAVKVSIKNDDDSTVERWGFINKKGEEVIKPQYDEVLGFNEGAAAVKLPDGKWGYIDSTGKDIIEPKFSKADCFSEGLAAASDDNGNFGYIDKAGKWVIKPQFELACRFSGDRAAVLINERTGSLSPHCTEDIYVAHGAHWNFIDKTGKVVIDSSFESTGVFGDGIAPVAVGTNQGTSIPDKWGFLNTQGVLAIKPQFANVHAPSEGMVAVQTGQWKEIGQGFRSWTPGKWGYINTTGKQIIESKFDGADPFSEGYAGILVDGKWGYIDKSGKVTIKPKFKWNGAFHEELAPVCIMPKEESK